MVISSEIGSGGGGGGGCRETILGQSVLMKCIDIYLCFGPAT